MSLTARYIGAYPEEIWEVLEVAWENGGISLQSNYARTHAVHVALAASNGWLSSIDPNGTAYSHQWRITAAGLTALHSKELFQ